VKYADLSCIRCGRALEPSSSSARVNDEDVPPAGGLLFISYGNYGSTVYDPQGNGQEYLLVVLCDDCAVAQAQAGNVLHVCKPLQVPRPPPRYRGPWQPWRSDVP
jgi:hypothetical protein